MSGFANTGFSNVNTEANESLASLSQQLVKVIHGSADGSFPVAGHTVASARATFAATYNIPADAIAFVNGSKVGEDYILNPNESLEFIKQAGRKG